MTESASTSDSVPLQSITITLKRKDLEPPVYIAGSFTKQPWVPEEMELSTEKSEENETVFSKTVDVLPGEYQYKFRLGDGEWWICDEKNTIVKDEAGNSNNLLIISPPKGRMSPKDEGSSISEPLNEPDTANYIPKPVSRPPDMNVEEQKDDNEQDSPLMKHESFLGTWEPDQELSPTHRRASTSLGVRISRIGTFSPPEPTAEDLKNPELESFPKGRKNILDRMEVLKNSLPEDDSAHLKEDFDELSTEEDRDLPIDSSKSQLKEDNAGAHKLRTASTLDRILEVTPSIFSSASGIFSPSTVFSKIPDLGRSYGTITANTPAPTSDSPNYGQDVNRSDYSDAKAVKPVVPEPTLNDNDPPESRRTSKSSNDSIDDQKSEKTKEGKQPTELMFFAMIAAWFRGFWSWLISGWKQEADNDRDEDSDTQE